MIQADAEHGGPKGASTECSKNLKMLSETVHEIPAACVLSKGSDGRTHTQRMRPDDLCVDCSLLSRVTTVRHALQLVEMCIATVP